MKIFIRNYRGVSAADFEHNKITFIGGRNHQGKTSIAEALAAVLTGEKVTVSDLLKRDIKKLVREGAKNGSCKIINGESTAVLTWPDCQYITEGPALKHISKIAAGLVSILDFQKKERADLITNYIKAEPTGSDLARELKAADIPADISAELCRAVTVSGFTTMYARAQEKGVGLKAQWEMITGERYGSKKAASWVPAAFYSALEAQDPATLQKNIDTLKKDLEAGIAAAAVSDQAIDQLKKDAGAIAAYEKDLKKIAADLDIATRAEDAAQKEFTRLSDMPPELACPHCGGLLQLKPGGKLEPYEEPAQEEIDDRAAALRKAGGELEKARETKKKIFREQVLTQEKLAVCKGAAEQLEKLGKKGAGKKWAGKVDDIRAKLEKAEADLRALLDKRKADQLAAGIVANKSIQDILGPDGLRKTKLNQAITPFNQSLSDLCQAAGWATVRMDTDYNFYMNDRPVPLCSASEKFQARAVLQLALGKMEGAQLILIDGADIIVGDERNGLFSAILRADQPAIVFMSLPRREAMPAMNKIGGAAYWIEKGELVNGKQ